MTFLGRKTNFFWELFFPDEKRESEGGDTSSSLFRETVRGPIS